MPPQQQQPAPADADFEGDFEGEEEYYEEEYFDNQPPFWIRNAWPIAIVISILCVGTAGYLMFSNKAQQGKQTDVNAYIRIVQNGEMEAAGVQESGLVEHLSDDEKKILRDGAVGVRIAWPRPQPEPGKIAEFTGKLVTKRDLLTKHASLVRMNEAYERIHKVAVAFGNAGGDEAANAMGERFDREVLPEYLTLLNQVTYLIHNPRVYSHDQVRTLATRIESIFKPWHEELDSLKKAKMSRVFSDMISAAQDRMVNDESMKDVWAQFELAKLLGTGADQYISGIPDEIRYLTERMNDAKNDEIREERRLKLEEFKLGAELAQDAYAELQSTFVAEFKEKTKGYAEFVVGQARGEWEAVKRARVKYINDLNTVVDEFIEQQTKRREVASQLADKAGISGEDGVVKLLSQIDSQMNEAKQQKKTLHPDDMVYLEDSKAEEVARYITTGKTQEASVPELISPEQRGAIEAGASADVPLVDLSSLREPAKLDDYIAQYSTPVKILEGHDGIKDLNVKSALSKSGTVDAGQARSSVAEVTNVLIKLKFIAWDQESVSGGESEYFNQRVREAIAGWADEIENKESFEFRDARRDARQEDGTPAAEALYRVDLLNALISAGSWEMLKADPGEHITEEDIEAAKALLTELSDTREAFRTAHEAYAGKVLDFARKDRQRAMAEYQTSYQSVKEETDAFRATQQARLEAGRALAEAAGVADDARVVAALAEIQRSLKILEGSSE